MIANILQSSIFKRFLIIYIAVTIPFLSISLIFSVRSERLLMDRLSEEMGRKTAYITQHIEAEYARIANLQQTLSLDSNLEALVSHGSAMNRIAWTAAVNHLQEKLRDYKGISPYIREMSVYIPGMRWVISAPYGQRYIYDNLAPTIFPGRQPPVFLPDKSGAYLGEGCLSVFHVRKRGEATLFVIETVISADHLFSLNDLDDPDSGYFLYGPEDGKITARERSVETAMGIARSFDIHSPGKSISVDGISYLVSGQVFLQPNIILVSFTGEEWLLTPLAIYRGWIYVTILLFFIMICVYAYLVQKYINYPVFILLKHFKLLEGGDMETRINVARRDEFGILYTHFNTMVDKLGSMVTRVYEQTIYTQKAELKQLQAQINPHFLYNSYFLLHRLIKQGDPYAAEFSQFLGEYFIVKPLERQG